MEKWEKNEINWWIVIIVVERFYFHVNEFHVSPRNSRLISTYIYKKKKVSRLSTGSQTDFSEWPHIERIAVSGHCKPEFSSGREYFNWYGRARPCRRDIYSSLLGPWQEIKKTQIPHSFSAINDFSHFLFCFSNVFFRMLQLRFWIIHCEAALHFFFLFLRSVWLTRQYSNLYWSKSMNEFSIKYKRTVELAIRNNNQPG